MFLAADSDFNSSTRELDLLPPSPTSFRSVSSAHPPSSPRSSLSQPDVLRTGVSKREHLPMNSFDSDFILPSRQIELLRVTEKRTALCVRTSSLEYPPSVSTATSPPSSTSQKRWTRPSSFDLCLSHEPCPVPVRTLSEDSGVQRLSAHSAGSPLRLCHTTLRVYPQYRTGLPKDTSVKVSVEGLKVTNSAVLRWNLNCPTACEMYIKAKIYNCIIKKIYNINDNVIILSNLTQLKKSHARKNIYYFLIMLKPFY